MSNFHPLKVVDRGSETLLQMGGLMFSVWCLHITLSRCSAYETHDKLLCQILSSIVHVKTSLSSAYK